MNDLDFDQVIHQPLRTKIMTYLMVHEECDFTTLKKELGLTDGHMSTHMKLLVESGYVVFRKEFIDQKPKTTYLVSKVGHKKFNEYLMTLKQIIKAV